MHAFELLDTRPLEIADGKLHRYRHTLSGATVLYMETAALEKTFTLQFRTLPDSHNGVCHIIEHAVFCGSRKYNVKDPFSELAKSSLNTYLNAITYPDRTVYPFATTNDQDFFNLLDIYLDAVFHPNFLHDDRILAQEGWHYEVDEAGELTINGIVYNEMKGMLSSPENVLTVELLTNLFDNSYKWHAAGNPKDIPSLTQEEMVAFYQKYYHPSQAVMAVYGQVEIEAVLEKIAPYLERVEEEPQTVVEVPATTFATTKTLYKSYPSASPDYSPSLTGIGIAHSQLDQLEDNFGLRLLTSILFGMESSPLKQVLVEKQLVSDIYANFDDTLFQPYTTVTLLDSYAEDVEAVKEVVQAELERLVSEGIDQDLITSVINQWKFLLLEGFENQGLPKGIMLSLDALAHVDRGLSPAEKLDYAALLDKVIERQKKNYFEELIQTHYLDNPHWLYLSLEPSQELYEEEAEQAKQTLSDYQASLTAQEVEQLADKLADLKAMQETPNSEEALASIPKLAVADLAPTIQTCPYEQVNHALPAYAVKSEERKAAIQQVAILFRQPHLTVEDLSYLNLLCSLLGYLGTQKRDAFTLSNDIAEKTGAAYFWPRVFQKDNEEPYVAIQFFSKYLKDQETSMLDLLADMAYGTLLTDDERIYQCLINLLQEFDHDFLDKGNELAFYRLRSYLSSKGRAESYLSGLDFYWTLRDLVEHFEEKKAELVNRLKELYELAFDKTQASVVYQGEGEEVLLDSLEETLQVSPSQPISQNFVTEFTPENAKEAFVISGEVNAVALGYDFKALGHAPSGALEVARKILNAEYLWDQVRVLSGAYGAELAVTADGSLIATSFRDPNLSTTLTAMKGMGSYLRQLGDYYQSIDGFIVGTVGELARPIPEADKIHHVIISVFDGYTDELRQRLYSEVLACSLDDLKEVADLLDKAMSLDYQVAFITPEAIAEATSDFRVVNLQADMTEEM